MWLHPAVSVSWCVRACAAGTEPEHHVLGRCSPPELGSQHEAS